MTTTLFTNAHIATGEPGSTAASTLPLQDILVTDGVFTAFGPGLAQQYEAQGGDLAAIEADIIERDKRDMEREFAPLRQAEDATYVDSSDMTIDEVITAITDLIH